MCSEAPGDRPDHRADTARMPQLPLRPALPDPRRLASSLELPPDVAESSTARDQHQQATRSVIMGAVDRAVPHRLPSVVALGQMSSLTILYLSTSSCLCKVGPSCDDGRAVTR